MKKLIFAIVLCSCAHNIPNYESPALVSPQNGESFTEFVDLDWNPNNKSDESTSDYSFFVEVASDIGFKNIKSSYSAKVWNHYSIPLPDLKSGINYWRVTATYHQSITNQIITLRSETRYFLYAGNDGAIYVNLSQPISEHLGTKLDPCNSVAQAFTIAKRRLTKSIILSNGLYAELIPEEFGYSIKACYDPLTWTRNIVICSTIVNDALAIATYGISTSAYYDIFN